MKPKEWMVTWRRERAGGIEIGGRRRSGSLALTTGQSGGLIVKIRMFLLGDGEVEANVRLFHYVPRAGVEQNCVLVELGQQGRTDAHKGDSIFAMSVEGGICETFAIVFSEKSRVFQFDVVDLIPRAAAVQTMPFFTGHLTFPEITQHAHMKKRTHALHL